jgi:chromosome segregation ATPase
MNDDKLDRIIALAEAGMSNLGTRLDAVEGRLTKIEERLQGMNALQSIDGRLERIETVVLEMNYQMRALNNNVLKLQGSIEHMEDRVHILESKPS